MTCRDAQLVICVLLGALAGHVAMRILIAILRGIYTP